MAYQAKAFGRILNEAVKLIAHQQHMTMQGINADLAERIHVSPASIHRWLYGRSRPAHQDDRLALAEVLFEYTHFNRTYFSRAWFEHFLTIAKVDDPEPFLYEHFPKAPELFDGAGLLPPPKPEMPPANGGFVGRKAELRHYGRALKQKQPAIITGMPGVGKTALAAALVKAQHLRPEQVFWHTFRRGDGITDLNWKLAAFLAWNDHPYHWQALSETWTPPPAVLFQSILQVLATRSCLLCFDDFHHIENSETLAPSLRTLLNAPTTKLAVIIVSRRMVEPILTEPIGGLDAEAARLLLKRHDIALEDAAFDTLHSCLHGNAQLLLLAVDLLKGGMAVDDVPQPKDNERMARYLLLEVYRKLSEEQRVAMRVVAILQDFPASRAAVEAILTAGSQAETLMSLVDRHLLAVQVGEAGRVYDQHDLIRAFFLDLMSSQERWDLHLCAARHFDEQSEGVRHMGEPSTTFRESSGVSIEEGAQSVLRAALHYEQASDVARTAEGLSCPPGILINQGRVREVDRLLRWVLTSPEFSSLEPEVQVQLWENREVLDGLLGGHSLLH